MIEVNLHPTGGKARRSRRPRLVTPTWLGSGRGGGDGRDPWTLAAMIAFGLAVLTIGGLWFTQRSARGEIDVRMEEARTDSTRLADLRVLTPKLSVHCPALQPAVNFIENPTKAPTDLILVVEARQIDQCGPKLFSIMFDGSCRDCKRTDCECPMDVRIMGTAHEEIAACNGRPFFEKPVFVMVWANFQPVMSATIDSWIALEAGANTLTVLVAKM